MQENCLKAYYLFHLSTRKDGSIQQKYTDMTTTEPSRKKSRTKNFLKNSTKKQKAVAKNHKINCIQKIYYLQKLEFLNQVVKNLKNVRINVRE